MAKFQRLCRIHVEEPCGDTCSPECRASWHLREAFDLVPRTDGRKGRMAVCLDCYHWGAMTSRRRHDEQAAEASKAKLAALADRINADMAGRPRRRWPAFGQDWR